MCIWIIFRTRFFFVQKSIHKHAFLSHAILHSILLQLMVSQLKKRRKFNLIQIVYVFWMIIQNKTTEWIKSSGGCTKQVIGSTSPSLSATWIYLVEKITKNQEQRTKNQEQRSKIKDQRLKIKEHGPNQPINQSTNQPINQSTNQPINQSTNQPIN